MRCIAEIGPAFSTMGAALLVVTLAAHSVHAQSGAITGLRGRVTDPSNAALPGVTVTVTSVDTGAVRTFHHRHGR